MIEKTNVDVIAWVKNATVGLHCLSQNSPMALRGAQVERLLIELIGAAKEMASVQVNRRPTMRNDSASEKKRRLREAIKCIETKDNNP